MTMTSTRCPACDQPIQAAQHARRGSWLYFTATAQPPYSTADLHLYQCPAPAILRRIMAADQHQRWTTR